MSSGPCRTGAYCLGAAMPPPAEVAAVAARAELRGLVRLAPERPPLESWASKRAELPRTVLPA
eukprot:12309718-Alexandrium_andersonii.AAC.1